MTDRLELVSRALGDRYALTTHVRDDALAAVYLGEDRRRHRPVIVKTLHPDFTPGLSADGFIRGLDAAGELHHPHILPVTDAGEVDGVVYYAMRHREGETAAERARSVEIHVTAAVLMLRDVVDAVAYAHREGIIHGDLGSHQVILSGGHALVTDFGVVPALLEALAGGPERRILGTPTCLAPEVASGAHSPDERSDLYAVGVLAYELLTGRPPFVGSAAEILAAQQSQAPDSVKKHRASAPPMLAQAVARCLEHDRDQRWQNADEMLPTLAALSSLGRVSVRSRGFPDTPPAEPDA